MAWVHDHLLIGANKNVRLDESFVVCEASQEETDLLNSIECDQNCERNAIRATIPYDAGDDNDLWTCCLQSGVSVERALATLSFSLSLA